MFLNRENSQDTEESVDEYAELFATLQDQSDFGYDHPESEI